MVFRFIGLCHATPRLPFGPTSTGASVHKVRNGTEIRSGVDNTRSCSGNGSTVGCEPGGDPRRTRSISYLSTIKPANLLEQGPAFGASHSICLSGWGSVGISVVSVLPGSVVGERRRRMTR